MNKFERHVTSALRNLRGNAMLAILMVAAIGVIISASMTTLLLLTAMAATSEPHQAAQLVALHNGNWGILKRDWQLETDRVCDVKSSGSVRLLL